ncbi:hypothetical protein JAAARDRAFT_305951 [Jaapia argillacea MUCL 33604]|uniref:Uncharacterized protein n=1 Tax=Jaapia argillacea MUCL 33604 TaxID=933084 RepID=A0A067PN60_9AGAM|nr:hypothetical protein JAAARDRAFT_305951 [Jaapia argillacea MUCL 33604]
MSGRLQGKVALITGAGNGIGLAAVKKFVAEGAKVIAVDLDITNAEKELKGNDSVIFVRGDVTKEDEVNAYSFLGVEKFGKLDVALLNAGASHPTQSWLETDVAVLDKMYDVNIKGPWLGMKHAVAAMISSPHGGKGGSVVLTASVASLYGQTEFSPYVASKWAVRGVGLTAAQEFGALGIRVNTIQPGATRTQMYMGSFTEETRNEIESANVLKRAADPSEIANVMLFLASDESSFMTGSTVAVHGGQTPT